MVGDMKYKYCNSNSNINNSYRELYGNSYMCYLFNVDPDHYWELHWELRNSGFPSCACEDPKVCNCYGDSNG
jgi:hypothetical protein